MKIITDKAEVALEFPDKAYIGTFGQTAHFEAHTDATGVALKLERRDDQKRRVDMHVHYGLFADILDELARSVAARPQIDDAHRQAMLASARALVDALKAKR